jgi:hypothetical protein
LESKVELLERLQRREVRNLDSHRDSLSLLRVDLRREHSIEKVEVRGLLLRSIGEERVEPFRRVAEPQLTKRVRDACVGQLEAHDAASTSSA